MCSKKISVAASSVSSLPRHDITISRYPEIDKKRRGRIQISRYLYQSICIRVHSLFKKVVPRMCSTISSTSLFNKKCSTTMLNEFVQQIRSTNLFNEFVQQTCSKHVFKKDDQTTCSTNMQNTTKQLGNAKKRENNMKHKRKQ